MSQVPIKAVASILNRFQTLPLHTQLCELRWLIPVIVLALAAIPQAGLHFIVKVFSEGWHSEGCAHGSNWPSAGNM